MADRDGFKTRIREVRKGRGLTLHELARRLGTTAQSVQRLETGKTKVNLDWLDRFATALAVPFAELIAAPGDPGMQLLGLLDASGRLDPAAAAASGTRYSLALTARNPVAVRLGARIGPYPAGSTLIADRLAPGLHAEADGRSCLVSLAGEPLLLRRVVVRSARRVTLVAHDGGEPVMHDRAFTWLAPVVMAVSYL